MKNRPQAEPRGGGGVWWDGVDDLGGVTDLLAGGRRHGDPGWGGGRNLHSTTLPLQKWAATSDQMATFQSCPSPREHCTSELTMRQPPNAVTAVRSRCCQNRPSAVS